MQGPRTPPPLVGGGWGEEGVNLFATPTLTLPVKGEDSLFLVVVPGLAALILLNWQGRPAGRPDRDDRGQVISLAAPPQRLVSLYGGLSEILIALGLKDRIVAHIQGDESLTNIPTVGTHLQPNVEMILALKPDLVLQGGVPKGMPALKKLESEGVPVAMFAPHDFPGLFSLIQRLGVLTGTGEAAAALNRGLEDRLAASGPAPAGNPTRPGLL